MAFTTEMGARGPRMTISNPRIVDGCEIESGDRDFNELERRRDQCLAEIQKVLDKYWYPPGQDGWPEMSPE